MKPFIALAIIVLLACSHIAGTSVHVAQPAPAASKFAFRLYDKLLKQDPNTNVFVSPTSISFALAMTYNGAGGKTREAMARVLDIEGLTLDEVNNAFANLQRGPAPADPKVQLNIANSLWTRKGITFKPDFLQRARQHYDATVTTLNFDDPRAPDAINDWVKQKTNNLIDSIVDRISSDKILFLINAIYFKGQWKEEFEKAKTKQAPFHLLNGQQKEVPLMTQTGKYVYFEDKDFQAVSLPYGTGRVSMYVFLPASNTTLADFQKTITSENWENWMSRFRITPGTIMLPRFEVTYEANLNEALKAIGMAEAFDPMGADFSGMMNTGERVYISEVKHKAFAQINEEGTKAAAVTSVGVSTTSVTIEPKPFVMRVDRPFFFAIRDNANGALLFMGSVVDPQ
ncbi:MAG TPA: serpin family protein [Pyrinomonadaceae bacterium]|nr:serpin family protein [Pyrinomonadaceae bacterium]